MSEEFEIDNFEDLMNVFENTGDFGKYYLGDYSNIQIANYLRKMQQENKQLKEDIKELFKENENKEKVIIIKDNIIKEARDYINKRMVHEGEYWIRKAYHFRNTEYGKDLLEILGEKE